MEKHAEFRFGHVAFFGRNIEEYVSMFDLRLDQLVGHSLLDCSAGPASFAFEASLLGIKVVAVDPMYELTAEELRTRVDADADAVSKKQANNARLLYAEVVPTPERRKSMELFLRDFETSKASGRYVFGKLPELPFADNSFDIVLSANFLFEYSDTASGGMLQTSDFDLEFHRKSVFELVRIARKEVRIYPLIAPGRRDHKYLHPIMDALRQCGHAPGLRPVKQKDIIGAEEMLQIIKAGKR